MSQQSLRSPQTIEELDEAVRVQHQRYERNVARAQATGVPIKKPRADRSHAGTLAFLQEARTSDVYGQIEFVPSTHTVWRSRDIKTGFCRREILIPSQVLGL